MFVLDSHCDTPSQINRLRALSKDNDHAHVDFPKLKRGGVDAAFFALYIPGSYSTEQASPYAWKLLNLVKDSVAQNRDIATIARTPEEAIAAKEEGKFAVCIALENGSPLGRSLQPLRDFFAEGVRYMTLCHSLDNEICDSCAQGTTWHGLSPFGKEVIAEMNRLGMLIDVSHISDEAFFDVIRCSKAPIAATHSCCRALAPHKRNLTDEMLRAIADNGGVVQINFYPAFLDGEFDRELDVSGMYEKGEEIEDEFIADPADPVKRQRWYAMMDEFTAMKRPSYKRIADHIDHAVAVAGIDHVGLGSDFDGICVTPEGMEDISHFGLIFDELALRGYSQSDISKIAGANFLRVWQDVQI